MYGSDLVIGSRYINGGCIRKWKIYRKLLSYVAARLVFPLTKVRDSISGFFVVKRNKFLTYFTNR